MTARRPSRRAAREAAEWSEKLSRLAISNDELHAFFAWRERPENREAYSALHKPPQPAPAKRAKD